jgi:hypothetical protein
LPELPSLGLGGKVKKERLSLADGKRSTIPDSIKSLMLFGLVQLLSPAFCKNAGAKLRYHKKTVYFPCGKLRYF